MKEPTFREAEPWELEILRNLLDYPEFRFLKGRKFKLLFRLKESKSKGRVVWGKCQALTGIHPYLHDYDFLIWLDGTFWGERADCRIALLHEQLCYCDLAGDIDKDEELTPAIFSPDVTGFNHNAARFGPWTENLKSFQKQLRLFDTQEVAGALNKAYGKDSENE